MDAFEQAIREVRAHYPEDIFPPDSDSIDARSAAWARKVCDNILRRAKEIQAEREEEVGRAKGQIQVGETVLMGGSKGYYAQLIGTGRTGLGATPDRAVLNLFELIEDIRDDLGDLVVSLDENTAEAAFHPERWPKSKEEK